MDGNDNGRPNRGWNDPPSFSFDRANALRGPTGTKGLALTRRVAHMLRPLPPSAYPFPLPNKSEGKPPEDPSDDPSNKSYNLLMRKDLQRLTEPERFEKVVKNLEKLTAEIKDDDICERLKVMEIMWTNKKLDEKVQSKLVYLTEALLENDIKLADHMQMALIVDHVAQCRAWMSGIRMLINYRRNIPE